MKKFLISMMLVVACVVMCFGSISCQKTDTESNDNTEEKVSNETETAYDTEVKNLLLAIKKDPSAYENKKISVKGWVLKTEDGIILSDVSASGSGMLRYELEVRKRPSIVVRLSDNKKVALLDIGDYVNVTGTVTISENEISLNECDYEMIKSIYE